MGYFDDLAQQKAAKAAQAHNFRATARQLAGQPVTVQRLEGDPVQGNLISVTPSSVWLVVAGKDEMVPCGEVAGILPATA